MSSLENRLGTSPELRMLLMSSRKDSCSGAPHQGVELRVFAECEVEVQMPPSRKRGCWCPQGL